MEAVDLSKQARFCNSFHSEVSKISDELSVSQYAADNGHWAKWDKFY